MKQLESADPTPSLLSRRSAILVGAATLLASSLFRQGLGLLTLGITARLLSPEDFGVAAYFLIAAALLEMLQRQITVVLIRLDQVTQEHLETTFTFQIIFGVIIAALFFISRPLVALIGIPELVQLAPALSALALIVALRSPRVILFERKLRFGYAAFEETISRIVYSAVVITLAWIWRDFWAIVIANFCALTVRSIWTFTIAPMSPRLSLARWRDGLTFSAWSSGAQLAQFFSKNIPQLVIGATLGLADGGIFRLGNRLSNLVTTQLFAPMQRVLYPGLADLSRTSDRRDEAFNQLNELLIAVVLPIAVGMALVADHIILVVLGYKWKAAAQVIWVLAPLKALETLQDNVRAASYVEGSTKLLFVRNVILFCVVSLLMWVGVQFGFSGALAAAGAASIAALFMTLWIAKRYGTRTFFGPLLVAWRSFIACAVMTVTIIIIRKGFGTYDEAGWAFKSIEDVPRLLVVFSTEVIAGVVVYIATHLLLWVFARRPDGFESFLLAIPKRVYRYYTRSRRIT